MSPFLPSCVQHLEGFSLRLVEARNNLRSLCRITTQYFITHNLIIYFFSSRIIAYFVTCIIMGITDVVFNKLLGVIMTFSDLGNEKAQLEIMQHENNSPSSIYSEPKPFTTKAPVHVIEALDTVAEDFGMSRNAFVIKLLEVYLGRAFVDFESSYGSASGEDPLTFPVEQLDKLIKKVNPSKEAQEYLERTVYTALGMPELLGDNQ